MLCHLALQGNSSVIFLSCTELVGEETDGTVHLSTAQHGTARHSMPLQLIGKLHTANRASNKCNISEQQRTGMSAKMADEQSSTRLAMLSQAPHLAVMRQALGCVCHVGQQACLLLP